MFTRYREQELQSYHTKIVILRDLGYSYWKQERKSLLESEQVKNPIPGKSKLKVMTKDELLTDPRLEGMIVQSLTLNNFNNQESETLMKRINYILQVLNT